MPANNLNIREKVEKIVFTCHCADKQEPAKTA